MPDKNPIKHDDPKVDVDTSGPEVEVNLPEEKAEEVVNTTEAPKEETVETKQEETVKEVKQEKKQDETLEDYSKGVQARISKLTRKMREAERREQAALDYARGVEESRKSLQQRFERTDAQYVKKFETSINAGLEAAQKELAAAIESGNAEAQVEANKRIATLAFENAKLSEAKEGREKTQAEKPVQLSDGGRLPQETPQQLPTPDPKAEDWAARNPWFGQNRAMTFTAFEIHKDLVNEGFDPQSDDYYSEVDKRIRVDFGSKFDNSGQKQSTTPVQTVASANRSVKPGRKTVRLTSSQVHIAKKLGVPLEEYAKQLKNTKEA
jgi:predicted metal-dependent hydrolase